MKKLRVIILALLACAALAHPVCAQDLKSIMESHKDEIITQCREYGIWPSTVVGMAGVESGYASVSDLAASYNNYWGISYSSIIARIVPCGSVYGGFASFPTFSDGLHAFLIWFWQGNYPGVASVIRNLNSTPEAMYSAVIASGYMTGTAGYSEGIVAHATAVGAYEWNKLAFPDGRKYVPYVEGMPDSVEVGKYDYPHDKYNPHFELRRLLTETPMESDKRISYEELSAGGDLDESALKKIQSEQRTQEIDPEQAQRVSVQMK